VAGLVELELELEKGWGWDWGGWEFSNTEPNARRPDMPTVDIK